MDNDFFRGPLLDAIKFFVQLSLLFVLILIAWAWMRPHPEHPIYILGEHPEQPIYLPGGDDVHPAHPIVLPGDYPTQLPAYLKCEWMTTLPKPEPPPPATVAAPK
jgi:hypothetical protein